MIKRFFSHFLKKAEWAILGAVFSCVGCGSGSDPWNGGIIKSEILKMIPLSDFQDPGESPKYVVGEGTFRSLRNLDTLSGDFFQLREGGIVHTKSIEGSIVESSEGFVGGKKPSLRYHVENQVAIPDDIETLTKLSVYYQYEQIAAHLEEFTGIPMKDIVDQRGIIRIIFHPEIHFESDASFAKTLQKMNAAFVPEYFQFLIFPPSRMESVPLSSNLQVLAHESGHMIFQHVLGESGDKKTSGNSLLDHSVMRGLNEGFADFMSYTFTGSTDVLGTSLRDLPSAVKKRNFSRVSFDYASRAQCGESFYCWGTVFAKALYKAQLQARGSSHSRSDRAAFFRHFVEGLRGAKVMLDADPDVQRFKVSHTALSTEQVFGVFFRALVVNLDPSVRALVRNELMDQFGVKGFPYAYR